MTDGTVAGAGDPAPAEGKKSAFEHRFEIIIATLLGLAAIATAFAAYQTDLRYGDALKNFQEGLRVADQASQQQTEVTTRRTEDQVVTTFAAGAVVNLTFAAQQENNEVSDEVSNQLATDLIESLGSPELKAANEKCNADPDCQVGPIDSKFYIVPAEANAKNLDAQSDKLFAEANENDEKGDKYSLITVILATALFLYGVAAVASGRGVKLATASMGGAIFFISMIMLVGA